MAGPLQIFVDIQNRQLVASNTSKTPVRWPTMVQGETPTLQIFFQKPDPSNTLNVPYALTQFSVPTIKLALISGNPTGGPDTALAYQETWTAITATGSGSASLSIGYQATFSMNTVGISNTLAGNPSFDGTIEIEVTESGSTPVKYYQGSGTVKAAVIDQNTAAAISAVLYLRRTETAGIAWRSVSPNGLYATDWGTNDDGTPRIDSITL